VKKFYLFNSDPNNKIWWEIYSEKGNKMTGPNIFCHESEAILWAKAYISSWDSSTLHLIENLDDIHKQSS